MPFCPNCGTEVQAESSFCPSCGRPLGTVEARVGDLRYRLSPTRILVMSVLSWSLYYFYWLYITWKHYRDHTREEVFPVWHSLTQLVPIYGLFRLHAHARSFKELMTRAGVATTINAGWAVVAAIIFNSLGWIEFSLGSGTITGGDALVITVIDIVSVVIVAWLLLHLQGNINMYWDSVSGSTVQNAKIGVGEVILAILGVLAWADTFATLLSPDYRAGFESVKLLSRCCLAG